VTLRIFLLPGDPNCSKPEIKRGTPWPNIVICYIEHTVSTSIGQWTMKLIGGE